MNTSPSASGVVDDRLPDLPEQKIDDIEDSIFSAIAADRTARRVRRGRWMLGGAAAAAVIVAAAAISPAVIPMVSGGAGSASDQAGAAPVAPVEGAGVAGGDAGTSESIREDGAGSSDMSSVPADRDIITTASATVVVDDVPSAAREVAKAAEGAGGYVESMSIGQSGQVYPIEPGIAYDSYPYPYPSPDGAWVTVRVPADRLTQVIDGLAGLGEVTASTISRQDVTTQTIDLQARIDAAQASVDRLTELMAQATDLTDLIAAESALSERQATLESYQQQLEMLDDQVAMSTLTVTLTPIVEPVEANPAGFTDGLLAGWNGLVATLNGIVVGLGFLIPWLVVIALAGAIVWAIVRVVRRRRTTRAKGAVRTPAAGAEDQRDAE